MHTPWGSSQTQRTIARGLVRVDTASHGGYRVDAARWGEIERMFPAFLSFAGAGWLEEDCDWAMAPLTWPALFTAQEVFNAVRSARSRSDGCMTPAWEQSKHGRHVLDVAAGYERSIAGRWEVGSLWGPVDGKPRGSWGVSLSRGAERKSIVFGCYPEKQFYTDADLSGVEV